MYKLFTLAFSLFATGTLYSAEACAPDAQIQNRLVLIEKYSRGKGSGVLYGGTTVLTNRHVVEDIDIPWVWVPALQKSIRADVVYLAPHKEADLAILKLRERVIGTAILPLAPSLQAGEELKVTGFPFGKKHKLSTVTGTLKSKAKTQGMSHADIMLTELHNDQTHSGDSGGGVFNCKGELAGIHFGNQAHIGKPKNSFSVHADALRRILKAQGIPRAQ